MAFFGKTKEVDPAGAAAPKRRSTFGMLFNPDIGASIKPLRDTTNVFVQLIGMIFAMNGLFPKDHPALRGVEGAKLSLGEIFATAWRDLSFTKEGLPKVILFFAVTGTLIFAVLSIITALMAGFVGSAHAQTATSSGGFFTPPDTKDDLGQNFIDYIFNGLPISNNLAQNGQQIPQTINIQCSMISMLGFYSSAMLVFAAVILFYHLISMVVSTAHEGVVMGKRANQIWAPIRLVVAIGLLVPVGTGSAACHVNKAGLNAGQFIVIKMAEWGSGLASQAWKVFLTTLSSMQYNYIQPAAPEIDRVVKDIVEMEACRYAWNYQVCLGDTGDASQCTNPNSYTPSHTDPKQVVTVTAAPPTAVGDVTYYYSNGIPESKGVCGSYTIPGKITPTQTATAPNTIGSTMGQTVTASISQVVADLSAAHQQTVQGLMGQFATVGAEIKTYIPDFGVSSNSNTSGGSPGDPPASANTDFTSLVNDYQTQLKTNLDAKLQGSIQPLLDVDAISALGWVSAGAWLNTIARDQGSIINAYEDGIPKTTAPDLVKMKTSTIGTNVADQLANFKSWLENGNNIVAPGSYVYNGCAAQAAASVGGSSPGSNTGPAPPVPQPPSGGTNPLPGQNINSLVANLAHDLGAGTATDGKDIVTKIFAIIDAQAQRSGIWNSSKGCGTGPQYFTLGAQLVTANPLAEFSFWGYANLRAAYSLYGDIFSLSVFQVKETVQLEIEKFSKGMNANNGTQQSLQNLGLEARYYGFLASIFSMFASIFFVCGYTVAFIVPLLPFFRFFFNVLTWIVSLLEAVVAVPLVALAHLNPEGEGLPGQSARAAYFMIFNVFVRPILTVFGLIAGLIVFYVAIVLLNATFAIAVAGTDASYHFGHATLIRIAYTLMYGATVYVCANNAFRPIGSFPEHALRWIGAQAHHERMGDSGRAVQGVVGQSQGFLGDRALGVIKLNPPN